MPSRSIRRTRYVGRVEVMARRTSAIYRAPRECGGKASRRAARCSWEVVRRAGRGGPAFCSFAGGTLCQLAKMTCEAPDGRQLAQAQFKKRKLRVTYRHDSSQSPALDWVGQNHGREAGEALIHEVIERMHETTAATRKSC